jgi:hypothetical protein
MDRSENVATPDVADTVAVPVSTPPAGFAARDIVTGSAKLTAVFPNGSRAVTWTGGAIEAPAWVLVG